MRGRKTQPEAVREAKGNPGRRRALRTPEAVASEHVGTPRELSKAAATVWKQIAPELERLKFLRPTDRGAFARYCEHLGDWWDLTRRIRRKGKTYLSKSEHNPEGLMRVNPDFLVRERIEKRLEVLEDRFGLSPAARQQILYRLSQAALAPTPRDLLDQAEQPSQADLMPVAEESPIGLLN